MRSAASFKSAFLFSFVSAGVKYLGAVAQLGASSAALSPSYVSVYHVETFHSSRRAYQGIATQHIRQRTSGLRGPGPLDIFSPLWIRPNVKIAAKCKEQKDFFLSMWMQLHGTIASNKFVSKKTKQKK